MWVPRDAVDDAIEVTGKGARRSNGKLPPHYFLIDVIRHREGQVGLLRGRPSYLLAISLSGLTVACSAVLDSENI